MKLCFCLSIVFVLFSSFPLLARGNGDLSDTGQIFGSVSYISMYGKAESRYAEQDLIADFQKQYPLLKVDYSPVLYRNFDKTLKTYLASSDIPDLITGEPGFSLRELAETGHFRDLQTSLFLRQESVQLYKKFDINRDGLFYIPLYWYDWEFIGSPGYSRSLQGDSPDGWDLFLQSFEMEDPGFRAFFSLGIDSPWTLHEWFSYLNLRLNGPDFHSSLIRGDVAWTDPSVEKVFAFWSDLIRRGAFPENPENMTWLDALEKLEQDEYACCLLGDFARDALHPALRQDVITFRFPRIIPSVQRGEIAPSEGVFVPSAAENPQGAEALIHFFLSSEHYGYSRKLLKETSSVDRFYQNLSREIHPDLLPHLDRLFTGLFDAPYAEYYKTSLSLVEEERRRVSNK